MATLANSMSAHAIKIAKCSTESLDTGTRPDHRGDTMGKEPSPNSNHIAMATIRVQTL
jgi:hypothetical protein